MNREDAIDDVTGATVAEMEAAAEDLYAHRDRAAGEVVASVPASEIRSVVSVRFGRGELDSVAAAADAAGLPLSTYIRNAALAAAVPFDLEAARRALGTALRAMGELDRNLGSAA